MGNGASSPKRADQSDAKNKTNNDTTAKKNDAAKQGKDTAAVRRGQSRAYLRHKLQFVTHCFKYFDVCRFSLDCLMT